jgi:hypothetical protein
MAIPDGPCSCHGPAASFVDRPDHRRLAMARKHSSVVVPHRDVLGGHVVFEKIAGDRERGAVVGKIPCLE